MENESNEKPAARTEQRRPRCPGACAVDVGGSDASGVAGAEAACVCAATARA